MKRLLSIFLCVCLLLSLTACGEQTLDPAEANKLVIWHDTGELVGHKTVEMNHSMQFWDAVERTMPDYKVHRKWLKDNGNKLIAKI